MVAILEFQWGARFISHTNLKFAVLLRQPFMKVPLGDGVLLETGRVVQTHRAAVKFASETNTEQALEAGQPVRLVPESNAIACRSCFLPDA